LFTLTVKEIPDGTPSGDSSKHALAVHGENRQEPSIPAGVKRHSIILLHV
jgi:hypothetical protein